MTSYKWRYVCFCQGRFWSCRLMINCLFSNLLSQRQNVHNASETLRACCLYIATILCKSWEQFEAFWKQSCVSKDTRKNNRALMSWMCCIKLTRSQYWVQYKRQNASDFSLTYNSSKYRDLVGKFDVLKEIWSSKVCQIWRFVVIFLYNLRIQKSFKNVTISLKIYWHAAAILNSVVNEFYGQNCCSDATMMNQTSAFNWRKMANFGWS